MQTWPQLFIWTLPTACSVRRVGRGSACCCCCCRCPLQVLLPLLLRVRPVAGETTNFSSGTHCLSRSCSMADCALCRGPPGRLAAVDDSAEQGPSRASPLVACSNGSVDALSSGWSSCLPHHGRNITSRFDMPRSTVWRMNGATHGDDLLDSTRLNCCKSLTGLLVPHAVATARVTRGHGSSR